MKEPRWRRVGRIGALGVIASTIGGLACGPSKTATAPLVATKRMVVVIRLGGPAAELEPSGKDLKDGLRQEGMVEGRNYTLQNRNAEGDPARVATLVDEAVKDGADLLIALHARTAPIVAERAGKVPVVFFVQGDPAALGLGENAAAHLPGVTGAFLPFGRDDLMLSVASCLPQAKRFGVAYNPDDRPSAAHKDALVAATPGGITVETAEFRQESAAVDAAKSLLSKGVDALILVTGMGDALPAVIEEARRAKVPCFGFTPDHARAGAVLSRTPNPRWGGFEAGRRAARVLAGADPRTIPWVPGPSYFFYANDDALSEFQIAIPGAILRGDVRRVGAQSKP